MRRISMTLVLALAATLMVGGSVAAQAATVQPRISTDGLSEFKLPPDLISKLAAGGVKLTATAGAKATVSGSTGYTTVVFPVIKQGQSGVVKNRGTLTMTSTATKGRISLSDPTLVLPATTGSDGSVVVTDPDSRKLTMTVFTVKNVVTTIKEGTPVKRGSLYIRKDLVSITGDMYFTDDAKTVQRVNAALVPSGAAPVITAGQGFGALSSSFSVTSTCKTPSECKGWTPQPE